ncbi:hypothetical protein BBJ28_00008298 [Nothophytophthora sp. Chile5]|nr:hypothetical protein BBJ28_00008298 [Nothophytophthora sp. Chile5]
MPVPTTVPPAEAAEQQGRVIPRQSFALVVASYTFRNLPPLSEKTKDVATALFNSLVDQHFNRFSRRGSRLLLNPSVIEFQDTMKELQKICAEEPDSSFFMCLLTHGARVTRGDNEGSYVLFSETRLSSEEELILTAVHERELAEMIHGEAHYVVLQPLNALASLNVFVLCAGIACKNKFVAVELCQTQEPKEKLFDDAVTIRHRIHDQFLSHLHKQLVQLRVQELLDSGFHLPGNAAITKETVQTNPKLLNLILVESCDVKTEVPVRANEENVSNFLLRLRDAFRSGVMVSSLDDDDDYQQGPRPSLFAKEVLTYVRSTVRSDAAKHNDIVHAEYTSQVRTKYERAAEFQDITHTPGVLGAEYAVEFGLGETPGTQGILHLYFVVLISDFSRVCVQSQSHQQYHQRRQHSSRRR